MNTVSGCQITIPFLQAGSADTPNTRGTSNEDKLTDYYQAMFVTFASIARFNPYVPLRLASNTLLPERYRDMYSSIGVQTQIIPFTRISDPHATQAFAASLYYLDVIQYLTGERNLVLDPDILCVDSLDFLYDFPRDHVGGIQLDYDPARKINGLSRMEAKHLHEQLGLIQQLPDYYGGEIYVLPSGLLPEISKIAELAWQHAQKVKEGSVPRFHTEEHIMNFVLANFPVIDLQQSIRRIWTTHRHRTVNGAEKGLSLWHLPAEKGRGFREIFSVASNVDSWFWHAERDDFVKRSARIMGISHRRLTRWFPDHLGSASNMLLGPKR